MSLNRFHVVSVSLAIAIAASTGLAVSASGAEPNPAGLAVASGPFQADWESLKSQYQTPDWFRDAKFGIWAHWGPQCQPEQGDWYARYLYMSKLPNWATRVDEFHRRTYGHPSKSGFKDVINTWKAENWDPDALMALYKRAGAQYFFALANHHDNLDLWDSKYQPWNSVRIGPKKDIVAGWARAARAQGLRFGVSVHAAHAWTWYEPSQGADATGEFAGVPYDGNLTAADGKGKWWEGLDPQDLYAQRHPRSAGIDDPLSIHKQWDWNNGASLPDAAYCEKFLNRTLDLINQHHPDLVYFDDTVLPLYPISDVGLKIAAHLYNSSSQSHGGRNEAVLFGKILNDEQRRALVWDVERGAPNRIESVPWQTCTCIGEWHYRRSLYDGHRYKTAKTVIQTLADVVSKNGNLLLSIPVRGDGTIDSDEVAIVEGIARWMDANRQCIFGTRPWKVYGEGPSVPSARPLTAQGFNEGGAFTSQDVRFTARPGVLYVIVLGRPTQPLSIKSLGTAAGLLDGSIASIRLLGSSHEVKWSQGQTAVTIQPPAEPAGDDVVVFAVATK